MSYEQQTNDPPVKNKNKKKNALGAQQMRRKRQEEGIQLRKQKRETEFLKRRHLSLYSDDEDFSFDDEPLSHMISSICNSNDSEQQLKTTHKIRKLLAKKKELDQYLCESLPIFMQLMQSHDPRIILEILKLFNQLIDENKENIDPFVKNSLTLVNILKPFFNCDNLNIIEQSLLIIANICSNSIEQRDIINQSDISNFLFHFISSSKYFTNCTLTIDSQYEEYESVLKIIRASTFLITSMCNIIDLSSYTIINSLLTYFPMLIKHFSTDDKTITNILTSIFLATKTEQNSLTSNADNLISHGIVKSLVDKSDILGVITSYLTYVDKPFIRYSIGIIANILQFGQSFTDTIIQTGCLEVFPNLINHSDSLVQKEVTLALSNITAGNQTHIQVVINYGLLPLLTELLYFGDYKTQCQITYVMYNISEKGNIDQIKYLMNLDNSIPNMDVIDAMATMLTVHTPEILLISLKFYKNLFLKAKKLGAKSVIQQRCNNSAAIDHLEMLQQHENYVISNLAIDFFDSFIMDNYHSIEDNLFTFNVNENVAINF